MSGNKEIQGTACYGRHAFSARHPTPERHPQPQRSNTACNSPASNSDIASWQVSQCVSQTHGPNGFITNRELSVTGSAISVHDSGNAVSFNDRRQCASNSVASTSQAGPSSQSSPIPSTSQHIWAPRSPWQGSPWSNAGVPATPGRGYRTTPGVAGTPALDQGDPCQGDLGAQMC